ncbi:MAG: HAD family hydrolase [Anaerolineae bacterium]
MLKCLLFDLDDTLLVNDMETFAPHYFEAISARFKHICSAELFMKALHQGTIAMWKNDGSHGTNEEVFKQVFFSRIEHNPDELMAIFDEFYRTGFKDLHIYTQRDPAARRVVEWAVAHQLQMVIATQPVFPPEAIRARLRWAGVGAEEFPYAMITTYDQMRATKPHPVYFQDILDRLSLKAEECCMVGDSLEADMPAGKLGFKTFWVQRRPLPQPENIRVDGQGDMSDLINWLETGGNNGHTHE